MTDNLKITDSRVRWIRVDALSPVRVFSSAPFGIFCCVYVLYRLLSHADSVFTQTPLLWGRSCCYLFTILFRTVFCCFYLLCWLTLVLLLSCLHCPLTVPKTSLTMHDGRQVVIVMTYTSNMVKKVSRLACFRLGSVSNDNSDGYENFKKAMHGFKMKQNKISSRASHVFIRFFAITARLQREIPSWDVLWSHGRKHTTNNFWDQFIIRFLGNCPPTPP